MDVATIPRVSSEELCAELQQTISVHFGGYRRIRNLRRRRSNYSSSYTIENLEVELDHGKRLSLVFKDLSPTSLLEAARRVRPQFLYKPQREIEIYRTLLDPRRFNTPACYGFVQRPELKRYWLFLERVDGPLLWQVGRFELWERSARWLASLHEHFAERNDLNRIWPVDLLRYDRNYCLCWMERAENFLTSQLDAGSKALRDQFKCLSSKFAIVVDRLLSLPQTLIHGEFYPSNVILRGTGSTKRVCPIDWEMAAVGPGLIDVAALVSGAWTEDQRKRLVTAYHDSLAQTKDWPPSLKEVLELVDYCQLYLAVQWLGWATDWSPPESHDQDWLREAVRLSKRLRL
jgi:hypothetical protein